MITVKSSAYQDSPGFNRRVRSERRENRRTLRPPRPLRLALAKLSRVGFLAILLLLTACGGAEETPLPPPPPTPVAEEAVAEPTPTPEPTATLPMPVVATPIPTDPPPPTPTEEPAPDAIFLLGPDDFGQDRNPLTGQLMDNPEDLARRPIAVKLSNAPPRYVRPQSGLNDADLVFEHITEGQITRLTAVFYGQSAPDVGPIRSGRLIDVEIPAMYDAAFVFSGASVGVNQRLNRSDFADRILRGGPGYYRTGDTSKPYEHTLYGRLDTFWEQMDGMGLNVAPTFTSFMAFSDVPPPGGEPASDFTLDYRWEEVRWEYDEELGKYRRFAAGEPFLDGNTMEQVTASNVIVVFANHPEDPTICEEIRDGRCLHLSLQIQIWGSAHAYVFRDGQRYTVRWEREDRSDMLTFYDADDNPFPLQIGNSWFQMMPFGREGSVQIIE